MALLEKDGGGASRSRSRYRHKVRSTAAEGKLWVSRVSTGCILDAAAERSAMRSNSARLGFEAHRSKGRGFTVARSPHPQTALNRSQGFDRGDDAKVSLTAANSLDQPQPNEVSSQRGDVVRSGERFNAWIEGFLGVKINGRPTD